MSEWPRAFPLSDSEWSRLAQIVALPERARPELENILGVGRYLAELDAREIAPSATKKRLAALRQRTTNLLNSFRAIDDYTRMSLIGKPDIYSDEYLPSPPLLFLATKKFEEHLTTLGSLVEWIKFAESRINKGTTGDKTSGARKITQDIGEFLKRHTPYKLTTGEKRLDPARDFLTACFEVSGIGVTADAMVRRMTSDRRRKVSAQKKLEL